MSLRQAGARKSRAPASDLSTKRLSGRDPGGTSPQTAQDTTDARLPEDKPDVSYLCGLLASGVYDHTGISHDRISASHIAPFRDKQLGPSEDQDLERVRTYDEATTRRDSYEDKATMVSPWLAAGGWFSPLKPLPRTCGSADIGHGDHAGGIRDISTVPTIGIRLTERHGGRERATTAQASLHGDFDHQAAETPESRSSPLLRRRELGINDMAPASLARAHRYAGSAANQIPHKTSATAGCGSHEFFNFPGNLPSVQPLRFGVSVPQSTHTGMTLSSISHSQLVRPAQRFASDLERQSALPLEERLLGEPMADDSLQRFIARLEREALEEAKLGILLDQDVDRVPRGSGALDKEMVDLQLHQFDVEESTGTEGEFIQPCDNRRASKSHDPHATGPRSWQQRCDLDDMDMTGFWRPNCFR